MILHAKQELFHLIFRQAGNFERLMHGNQGREPVLLKAFKQFVIPWEMR